MTKPRRKLPAKRQAFVVALAGPANGNASEAARLAGYAPAGAGTEGYRLLQNADVLDAVERLRGRVATRAELTQAQVIEDMQDIASMAQDGGDLAVALRAHELLGKYLGMFDKRSTRLNVTVDTSAELLAAMHRQAKRRALEPLDVTPVAPTRDGALGR